MFKVTITCAVISLLIIVSCQTTYAQPSDVPELTKVATEKIEKLLEDLEPLLDEIVKNACTAAQGLLSTELNDSLKKEILEVTEKHRGELAEVHLPNPLNFNGFSSSNSDITLSEFKFSNVVLKGLDGIIVNKYVIDICRLYSEAELSVPKLQMTATYTLNGMVKGSPVSGSGEFTLDINELHESEYTNLACLLELISDETCKGSQKKTALDITIKKATVNMSGLKYENYDENKINDEINKYISQYITSDKIDMWKILTDKLESLFNEFKAKHLRGMSLSEYLNSLKRDLSKIPASFSRKQRSLRENAYLRFVSIYV